MRTHHYQDLKTRNIFHAKMICVLTRQKVTDGGSKACQNLTFLARRSMKYHRSHAEQLDVHSENGCPRRPWKTAQALQHTIYRYDRGLRVVKVLVLQNPSTTSSTIIMSRSQDENATLFRHLLDIRLHNDEL